jgi:hypothetical protein
LGKPEDIHSIAFSFSHLALQDWDVNVELRNKYPAIDAACEAYTPEDDDGDGDDED